MKNRIAFKFLILLLFLSSLSFPQKKMTYGVKGGIGFGEFMSLKNNPSTGTPPDHSYPICFSIGLFIENKLTNKLSLINELLYENNNSKITISLSNEGILEQKVTAKFISLPIHLKYGITELWNVYLYFGPNFAYLVQADYYYTDKIYQDSKGNVKIKEKLPSINTSVDFGFGKLIKFSGFDLSLELRAQLGITKFHYENIPEYTDIGNWRNGGLIFFVGYQF
jgi:hypothetical protein